MRFIALQTRLPVVTRALELWNERNCSLEHAVDAAVEESDLEFLAEDRDELMLAVFRLQMSPPKGHGGN